MIPLQPRKSTQEIQVRDEQCAGCGAVLLYGAQHTEFQPMPGVRARPLSKAVTMDRHNSKSKQHTASFMVGELQNQQATRMHACGTEIMNARYTVCGATSIAILEHYRFHKKCVKI